MFPLSSLKLLHLAGTSAIKSILIARNCLTKTVKMTNFELIAKAAINDSVDVFKYKSKTTGLTVVLADIEGPVVNGHFVLATEAHDDDGLPHTLEHLIFLGSEKYPYKGVLDLLANRCLASGTNAWTDTDHTCYTMTTAGSDGFLDLMPIYLDHILYPTLSDSGFITEVHHISGEGEDGGVVYCEMQGRENTGESRTILTLLRAMYPNSGYSAETGGIMHNLRTSTNNEKVRKYHAEFYRPENLTLIITGKVKPEKVFEALKPVEENILSKGTRAPFVRPWLTPVCPVDKSQDIKILYPSDEEDCGLVYVGYRGPNTTTSYLELTACNILLRYLTDTSVSPLQREFVEIEDPFASKVSNSVVENLEALMYFIFDNVPVPKIDLVLEKFKGVMKRFVTGEETFDMKRMHSIIEREILEAMSNLEGSPHETAAFLIIGDIIYGHKEEDFVERLQLKQQFEILLTYDEAYWVDLHRRYLVEPRYVCVRSYPSIEEQNRMSKEELDRIEKQRKDLGPEGLKLKAKEVKDAMVRNEIEPPESMLTEVPIPSTEGMNFHYLQIHKSNQTKKVSNCIDFDDIPVYAEIYDLHTNFAYLVVSLNTDGMDISLKPYMLLFLDLLQESPVKRGDKLIPYEDVVSALERDTICNGAGLGLESHSSFSCGPFSHVAVLSMQVDPKKYEIGVGWVIDILHNTVFFPERVRVCASKLFNAVSQAKRKGNSVVRDLLKAMYYPKDSNIQISFMLKQQKFLAHLLKQLENPKTAMDVVDALNRVRAHLTRNENIAVHIAANIKQCSAENRNLTAAWSRIAQNNGDQKRTELTVIPDWTMVKYEGVIPDLEGTIVGMGCVESAFLYHATQSIHDFSDPDLPALMLYLQYLTQLEGSLWKQIRGQGFAYGYNIVPRPHEGILCMTLYRATNVVAAFKEAKTIIESQLSEATWDPNLLESARSSLIFEIIERERSVGNMVTQGLLFSFKQVGTDYNRLLVKKVNEVTEEKLNEVGKKYVAKLFSSNAKTAIVCHPDKVKEIAEAFKSLDRNLTAATCLEESILAL